MLFDDVAQSPKYEDRRNYRVPGLVKIDAVGAYQPRWQGEAGRWAPAGKALDVGIASVFELIVETDVVHLLEDVEVSR